MNSQTPDMQAVLERLDSLERQNRRLKRVGVLALAFVGALALMGQASRPKTLEAEQFVIRDHQGRVRAEMGMYEPEAGPRSLSPEVKLFDERGRSRVALAAYPLGPSLDFYDDKGNIRVELVHVDGTGPGIEILGPPGRGEQGHADGGRPGRLWPEPPEGAILKMDEGNKTGPVLDIMDRSGFEAMLGDASWRDAPALLSERGPKHTTSAASLVLLGKDGKPIWRAP